jgi:hypothetical protein
MDDADEFDESSSVEDTGEEASHASLLLGVYLMKVEREGLLVDKCVEYDVEPTQRAASVCAACWMRSDLLSHMVALRYGGAASLAELSPEQQVEVGAQYPLLVAPLDASNASSTDEGLEEFEGSILKACSEYFSDEEVSVLFYQTFRSVYGEDAFKGVFGSDGEEEEDFEEEEEEEEERNEGEIASLE